jgi:hypothetical protein
MMKRYVIGFVLLSAAPGYAEDTQPARHFAQGVALFSMVGSACPKYVAVNSSLSTIMGERSLAEGQKHFDRKYLLKIIENEKRELKVFVKRVGEEKWCNEIKGAMSQQGESTLFP